MTVSTSGIPEGIRRLAAAGRPWNLALSLHATSDERRARLIPPAHRAPLADILAACRLYRKQTGRLVTLEYALIAGGNDTPEEAGQLARIARELDAKVNLIACNPTASTHRAPDARAIAAFERRLAAAGARVTVRRSKGEEIAAACGQLRRQPSPST